MRDGTGFRNKIIGLQADLRHPVHRPNFVTPSAVLRVLMERKTSGAFLVTSWEEAGRFIPVFPQGNRGKGEGKVRGKWGRLFTESNG